MNRRSVSPHVSTALLAAALTLGACASDPIPSASLATARSAITEAEAAGAMQSAPVELLSAREKLDRAQNAVSEEQYVAARRFAERAEADALLAERRARAMKAERAAQELARSNELLRREAGGGATQR
jgi:hypothetical protein